jgi:sugar lactone lactonase YvrE
LSAATPSAALVPPGLRSGSGINEKTCPVIALPTLIPLLHPGFGTEPGKFRTPHSLAFDSQGRLFVADRGNVRIQIFDQDGTFIDEWHQFGRLSGIYIDANDVLYAADSESSSTSNPGWRRGIRVGSAITGHVFSFIPDPDRNPGGTSAAEGVAADKYGNIYGAEAGPRQVVKYVRED